MAIIRKKVASKNKSHNSFEKHIRNIALKSLSKEELIVLSDELLFELRRVSEEILARKDCEEMNLRYILRYSPKETRNEAAKRLLRDFPSRDNLALIIRYCIEYRQQAWELLKKIDSVNAETIFLNNIYYKV